jgi:hypothetical protein
MDKEKLMRDKTDLEWVLSTPQGRRVLWSLLSHCGIYRDIEGQGDAVFKQIGRRQVGLHLLQTISDASEDRLEEMMREARNEAKEEKLKYERANKQQSIDTYIDGELPEFSTGDFSTQF